VQHEVVNTMQHLCMPDDIVLDIRCLVYVRLISLIPRYHSRTILCHVLFPPRLCCDGGFSQHVTAKTPPNRDSSDAKRQCEHSMTSTTLDATTAHCLPPSSAIASAILGAAHLGLRRASVEHNQPLFPRFLPAPKAPWQPCARAIGG
jgi:hypothetical protein